MVIDTDLRKCISFIESGFYWKTEEGYFPPIRPAITISRMAGAGGHTVASDLAEYLELNTCTHDQWAVFDRNLVERILEEHHLHKRIAEFMQERHKTMFSDVVEEWMGLHPGSWTLLQRTNATIMRLAHIGNVIIVGRGGSHITRKLPNAFHVRLIGSVDKRIGRIANFYNMDQKTAQRFVKEEDDGRRRYLKSNFDRDIDDPLLYHLTINCDMVRCKETARMVGNEVIKRFSLDIRTRATETGIRITGK